MSDPATTNPVFTFKPFMSPRAVKARSIEELLAWVAQERDAWSPIRDVNDRLQQELHHITFQPLRDVENTLSTYISHASTPGSGFTWEALADRFKQLESEWSYLCSASPLGQRIIAKSQSDRSGALADFLIQRKKPLEITLPNNNHALDLVAFIHGVVNRTYGGKIAEGARDQEYALAEAHKAFSDLQNALEKTRDHYSQAFSDIERISHENMARTIESNDAQSHSHSARMLELENTYLRKLQLEAPVSYWTTKARRHEIAATWLFVALFLSSSILIWLGFTYYPQLVVQIKDHLKTDGLALLAIVSAPAIFGAAIIRIISRMHRDNLRARDDAEQRATLVNTFLSLANDKNAEFTSSERILALHAVFRGSANIDSPDDLPPINSLEATLQVLGRQPGRP